MNIKPLVRLWRACAITVLFWVEFLGAFFALMFTLMALGKFLPSFLPKVDGGEAMPLLLFALFAFCAFRSVRRARELRAKQGTSFGTVCASLFGFFAPIAVLMMIAFPNFERMQWSAQQSEAKIALAAIYGGEKSYFSEYKKYSSSLYEIGYSPESQRRFYMVGFAPACADGHGVPPKEARAKMHNSSFATPDDETEADAWFRAQKICRDPAEGFEAYAVGIIRKDGERDVWRINEKKELVNLENGFRKKGARW
jgi:hypothetical protein